MVTYIYMYIFHTLDVDNISPSSGSYGGGTLITLYGRGMLVHTMCLYNIS